ncbi:hypothetical protein N7481_006241 [Penicillium waksmanii]|uniref:uncharacterized protein n=1 Tax=Penicillium waksmanii TaxID=69791 RepID=UPI0025479298|nr:uncharacterized protein N7481_006241 [Penicillium waksmanii]KAJ5984142.1 hypothetical protein N7481_006241 [Penicillium waksmanii]
MGCKIYAESLKLMKDDLKEILGTTAKPHNPTDFVTITDEQFALEQWKKEIDDVDASIHDRQLALKVARVPRADAALISAILKEEDRSRTDRRIALHMSGNMAPAAEDQSSPSLYEQQMCRVVGTIMAEEKPDLKRSAVDISKDENGNGNESKQASLECVACGEQGIFFTMVEAPCSHYYCQVCLIQLFSASLKDESLFPPRCCRIPMPLEPVRTLIGPETSRRVEAKNIEISDTSRTYCSKQTCSAYIPPTGSKATVAHAKSVSTKHAYSAKRTFTHQESALQSWTRYSNWRRPRVGSVVLSAGILWSLTRTATISRNYYLINPLWYCN